jgi:hypothetical protein
MALFPKQPKFRPTTSNGIIAKMEKVLDTHSDFLENIKEGTGIIISKNAQGGITINANPNMQGRGGGTWSGAVWYLGDMKYDFYNVDYAPDTNPDGTLGGDLHGDSLTDTLSGIYLKIKLVDGSYDWADTISADTDEYNYYPVGVRSGSGTGGDPYTYTLSNRVCGDIRIDLIPHICGDGV